MDNMGKRLTYFSLQDLNRCSSVVQRVAKSRYRFINGEVFCDVDNKYCMRYGTVQLLLFRSMVNGKLLEMPVYEKA
jgi:hypothetical protein